MNYMVRAPGFFAAFGRIFGSAAIPVDWGSAATP